MEPENHSRMVWENDTDTGAIRLENPSLSKIFPSSLHNLISLSVTHGMKLADWEAQYLVVFETLMAESAEVSRRLLGR